MKFKSKFRQKSLDDFKMTLSLSSPYIPLLKKTFQNNEIT